MFRFAVFCLCVSLTLASPTAKGHAKVFPLNLEGPRIINGQQAGRGQFPWQAAVFVTGSDGSWFCGGSIISQDWILTAGHCVNGATGATIITGTLNPYQGQSSSASVAVLHEGFNGDQLANDIGLFQLSSPLPTNDVTRPIQLSSDPLAANVGVTVSGWGLTRDGDSSISQNLNYVHLSTISNSACSNYYGAIRGEVVCATSDNSQTKSTCSGDSGGPLVINVDSNPVHVAVVSFVSSAGCESGAPSGYTRTATYRDWIRQATGV